MNLLLAARDALASVITPNTDIDTPDQTPGVADMARLSVDVFDTQGKTIVLGPRNVSLFHVNLKKRVELSDVAMWRNPTRTITTHWSRREMMHVFNGWFRQSILKEWDRYETFGKCYTCPDPFKNDDPPWKASFCL